MMFERCGVLNSAMRRSLLLRAARLSYFLVLSLAGISLFLAYVIPYHSPPWSTFHSEWLAAISIVFLFFLAIHQPGFSSREFFLGLLTVVVIVPGVLLFPADAPVIEQIHLLGVNIILAFLAYLAGRSLFGIREYKIILAAILGAGVISALIGLMQWSGVFEYLQLDKAWVVPGGIGQRIIGNIGQPNNLGTLLLISLVILLTGCDKYWTGSFSARVGLGFLMLILTAAIALTASRSAWLSLLVVAIVATLSHRRHGKSWPRGYFVAIAMVVVAWLLAPHALGIIHPEAVFAQRPIAGDPIRIKLWSMVIQGILEKPWAGWGPGGQAVLHQTLSPEFGAIGNRILNQSHNFVLDILVVFGVVLGGLIILFLAHLGRAIFFRAFGSERLLYLLLCLPIFVHALVEYPHYYGFFLWPFWLFAGAAMAKEQSVVGADELFRFRPLPIIFLVTALALAFKISGAYLVLEDAFTNYAKQRYRAVSVEELDAASKIFPGLRLKLDALKISRSRLEGDEVAEKIGLCANYYPLPDCLTMQATIEANRGDIDSSRLWLIKACNMFGSETCKDKLGNFNGGEIPGWAEGIVSKAK